jgi:FkbM family methyltransferase
MKKLLRSFKAALITCIDYYYSKRIPTKKRIGTSDNWYILTNHISNAIIYSGGVGKDITFEIALASEYNCSVFLYDPSPTGKNTIESLELPKGINYFPLGLAERDGIVNFSEPINPLEGSFRLGGENTVEFECRSISSLMKENKHDQIELLKIDIEGFEYAVIDDIISNKLKIRQIAVEFHDFYKEIKRGTTNRSIRLLKENGYTLVHKRGHDYTFVKSNSL